jgi:hypothetical protein
MRCEISGLYGRDGMKRYGHNLTPIALSSGLGWLVSACAAPQNTTTLDENAAVSSAAECVVNAAYRVDDGQTSISQLAEKILIICGGELRRARSASQLPTTDPQTDLFLFQQTVEVIEKERKTKLGY